MNTPGERLSVFEAVTNSNIHLFTKDSKAWLFSEKGMIFKRGKGTGAKTAKRKGKENKKKGWSDDDTPMTLRQCESSST